MFLELIKFCSLGSESFNKLSDVKCYLWQMDKEMRVTAKDMVTTLRSALQSAAN